jgi:hypothetical protein
VTFAPAIQGDRKRGRDGPKRERTAIASREGVPGIALGSAFVVMLEFTAK